MAGNRAVSTSDADDGCEDIITADAHAIGADDDIDDGCEDIITADAHAIGADDDIVVALLLIMIVAVAIAQLDGRSIRAPRSEQVVVRTDFFEILRRQRSVTAYRKTLRCTPESFDALCAMLEPLFVRKYGFPRSNALYTFDMGLAVLLTYYGNGAGIDGDGIGGAATQMGMSRTSAGRFIENIEELLVEMMHDVIRFPAVDAAEEWEEMVDGFAAHGGDFPNVACVFDGTIIRTTRPQDFQGYYDKSGNTAYNCLAGIDHRFLFRYFGVFSGSNSDQSMWNQSQILGHRARFICPPGINWLGDSGFKLWPFLMVPFDERGNQRLSQLQRCFNYHLSQTRILVECAFGRLKNRFKVLHGVINRKTHHNNTRMICATAVLHNLLIDVGDRFKFESKRDIQLEASQRAEAMATMNVDWDRTQAELDLATAKRNTYMERFWRQDHGE